MSGDSSSDEDSRSNKKSIKSNYDQQRLQLEKLMQHPVNIIDSFKLIY
jgi:hypothetical protein